MITCLHFTNITSVFFSQHGWRLGARSTVVLTRFGSSNRQCVDGVPTGMNDTTDFSNSNDTRYSLTILYVTIAVSASDN
jgi:hypothetical protein